MTPIRRKFYSLLCGFGVVFLMSGASQATVYFDYDTEEGVVGEELPHHQSSGPEFCGPECGGAGNRATIQTVGGAPQGDKYFVWQTWDSLYSNRNDVKNKGVFPVNVTMGQTYYLAYYQNFERIDGEDIWYDQVYSQSGDKGVELNGSQFRWVTSRGQWTGGHSSNQDHRYTVWLGNPTYHVNPELEHSDTYWQNQNGYSETSPIQLEYETWYSIVMAIKAACDHSGFVTLWVNGEKILSYENIQTAASCTADIGKIEFGGTIAQPAYDAPAHYRKFDALLLTDNWQDIVDGGYLAGAPSGGGASFSNPGNVDTTISWPDAGQ